MGDKAKRVEASVLEAFVCQAFEAAGLTRSDAELAARMMVDTNLYGVDSHGVLRLGIYIRRLRAGQINPRPRLRSVAELGALEVLDGDNGLGYLVGSAAMGRAIGLAQAHGAGVVAAAHSNHFGAAALYARMAAQTGMIGLCLSNVQPNMVLPGGSAPVVGNNPLAIAAPTSRGFPFVLDMALSQVAGGKLLLAAKKGQTIPLDWATDREGRPTDDPEKGFAGFLLPMGGYKGYGLALAVDILCGVLAGSGFLSGVKGMYREPQARSEIGHFMLAINCLGVAPAEEWSRRMDAFADMIKAAPMWDPDGKMLLPGEIEQRTKEERAARGIPLPVELFTDLNRLSDELGLDLRLSEIIS